VIELCDESIAHAIVAADASDDETSKAVPAMIAPRSFGADLGPDGRQTNFSIRNLPSQREPSGW